MKRNRILAYFIFLIITFSFSININSVNAGFSDVNFEEPHDNYSQTPPSFTVNNTPSQDWKKTDVDFSGSIGDEGEFALELTKSIGLSGKLPGKLAAVEGSLDFGMKLGIRYDIEFGYLFGVDYYHWANDMAVSAGEEFSYLSYVEPDPDRFDLWATITIEPFIELWGDFDVYLELAGYEIVDWDKKWAWDESLPFEIDPNINLGLLLESGLLTPIGDLYSSPQIGLGIEIPDRLEFDIGFLETYFDFGAGAYIQFQVKGLLESLTKIAGDAGAKIDRKKTELEMKYYDAGKKGIKSIDVHVPADSVGKVLEVISQDFKYSVEPGILIGTEGHIDVGFHLHIPTPTKQVEKAVEVVDDACDWSPFGGWLCHKVTKTVMKMVDVAGTICPDIDYDWDWSWSAEKEWWIPFFTIPLLKSSTTVSDEFTVLDSEQHPLSITENWRDNIINHDWELDIGPSALRLDAYAGYSLDFLLNGMMYTDYKKDDQIAGHPFNYYVGVDGEAEDGLFGGWFSAGYGLDLKIPYIDEWVKLIGYDFNTSDLSGRDIPLFEAEYTCGVAAISLAGEAEFNELEKLQIEQSANGFLGEWMTTPFLTMDISLDGKVFEVININLGSVTVEFLLKGTGDLSGDISASGAGLFDSSMNWNQAGDINYGNIYPKSNSQKGDIIDILIHNLKYNFDLDLVIRVSAKLYAQYGYLKFSHDFDIPIDSNIEANINENITEEVSITKGFNPTKITDIPEEVTAGEPFLIGWESANSSAGQTRIQYGKNPYPNKIYDYTTPYETIDTMALATHNKTIILNKTGTWYFTSYLKSNTPPFQYHSKIYMVNVTPRINFTSIPSNATAGEAVNIGWEIFGPSSVESTNVLLSNSPNPTSGTSIATETKSGGTGTYSTSINFNQVGTYYLIAQARVDKEKELHYTLVKSIEIMPDILVTILPSPNNASKEFMVNWTIYGAEHIDKTYLQYSPTKNFSNPVYTSVPQYGYEKQFTDNISIYVKGTWYLKVYVSVDSIDKLYYSGLPLNSTEIYPYSEINLAYPENVSAGESFDLNWWVFGFNSTVNKTQIFYDNDKDVFSDPIGNTTAKSGNETEYSDIFTILDAGLYYFQANFSVDNEHRIWNSSIIDILVIPEIKLTYYPDNATAFTYFDMGYDLNGLNITTTTVDLWFGETDNVSEMNLLNQSVTGGNISGFIPETGLFYFAINLTFMGVEYWTETFSIHLLPYIKVKIPWNDIPSGMTQVNPDMTPGQFAIAGIPVTFEWIISNCSTVNHTDIHFQGIPKLEPNLVPIVADYYRYDFTAYTLTSGWMTTQQTASGAHYYVFRQNVTFYSQKFKWVFFKVNARCDNKSYNYYSNSSGIAVYPAAEAISYNYSIVVNKTDIALNPKNITLTWGMGYVLHNWTESIVNNSPNYPGIIPEKVIGIKYAAIPYCLNYDPLYWWNRQDPNKTQNAAERTEPALPGIFNDKITINSTGTYYFRIFLRYDYSSKDENFTYPQHINRSYWSPLYKIDVLSFGMYNTSVPFSDPTAIEYGDLDMDGDLDMLIGNGTGSESKVILYFNDGTGNYTNIPRKILNNTISGTEITSIEVGHLNSDSALDFVMANQSGSYQAGHIYLNDGNCSFTYKDEAFDGKDVSSYDIADIDGDNIDDYIYYDPLNYWLLSNLSTPSGDYTPYHSEYIMGELVESLELCDLDGSPDKDLIIALGFSQNLSVFPQYPYGALHKIDNITATFFDPLNTPLTGDFNNDGFKDIIVVNDTGEVILTINASTNARNYIIGYSANPGMTSGLAAGDFDHDEDLDLVIGIGSNRFQFFFNNNSMGPFDFPGFSSQVVSNMGDVIDTGDFNLDGYIDISGYRLNNINILHFLNDYIPPPQIENISVSYNSMTQFINIENVSAICQEVGELNNTNTYVELYTILNGTFHMTDLTGNLTWNGNSWEALNINVSSLPEGIYYINTTFGGVYSFGNNTYTSQMNANFSVDHFINIYGINVDYLANETQKINITIDIVNSTYTGLRDIKGLEAAINSYTIYNSTGHNTSLIGNFTYGNTTGAYNWETINVSTSSLAPGDYYISVNFSDYLGYDSEILNSSIFTVDHTLISLTTPSISYTGNYSQIVDLRNIKIRSTYNEIGDIGKGAARIYNYSIYYDNGTYTGLTGVLDYDGFSWYADISASSLPEGDYYINAYLKDKLNDKVITPNSSCFTIDHTIDLRSLNVVYKGYMIQEFNISISPESTYDLKGLLDNSEVISSEYTIFNLNKSSIVETGNLTWSSGIWNKIIDVSQYLEDTYVIEIGFTDSYETLFVNSSILLPYHYIKITKPIFEYDFSLLELGILNFTANCSYNGIIDDSSIVPTNKSYKIVSDGVNLQIGDNFTYSSSFWHKANIDLNLLTFSNITIYMYFEVNESFGSSKYNLILNSGTQSLFISDGKTIEITIDIKNPPSELKTILIKDPVIPDNYIDPTNPVGLIYRIEVNDESIEFNSNISIRYSQNDIGGLNEWLLTIFTFSNGSWVEITDGFLDTEENIVTVSADHFSYFIIMQGSRGLDSDGDGLTDWEEVDQYGTDPNSADTDGDGYSDGEEIDQGTDPNNPNDYPLEGGFPRLIILIVIIIVAVAAGISIILLRKQKEKKE
ncbi:MAG: hypothetical protein GF329_22190 [Candidatus Lokiarchaeota archaeon]|nr:hypothetical protein [Candidatus Lokiarchaeota archaeon]